MAGSVNRVTLLGNLGSDPEIKHTQDGRGIANLRVATSDRWKDKMTGEQRERTEWHKVTVFGDSMVGFIERFLHKGSKVYIEGRLQTRRVPDHNTGQDRYYTEVVVQFPKGLLVGLDPRSPPNDGGGYRQHGGGASHDSRGYEGGGRYGQRHERDSHERSGDREAAYHQTDDDDDDIPF